MLWGVEAQKVMRVDKRGESTKETVKNVYMLFITNLILRITKFVYNLGPSDIKVVPSYIPARVSELFFEL